MSEFAGDPAMPEVREHAGWKPVLATLLVMTFCVSAFFSQPDPEPSRIALRAAASPAPATP